MNNNFIVNLSKELRRKTKGEQNSRKVSSLNYLKN